MKRYTFYFLIAFTAFTIGTFAVIAYFHSLSTTKTIKETKFEMTQVDGKWKLVPVDEFTPRQQESIVDEPKQVEFKELFCNDEILLPIWNLLLKDRYFREQSGLTFREPNCAEMFEVLEFDLNSDNQKEILLRAKAYDLCGATGNCGFWIFEKKGRNYRKILSTSDYVDITEMGEQIKKIRTKDYLDIVTKGHFSVSDTRISTYKFNGRRYVESKCLVDAYVPGSSENPKWELMSCKKFYKRWENEN